MFDRPSAEATGCCATVPLSHLSLDLVEPPKGWLAMFAARGIETVVDDLGRPAIPREVLGDLIAERAAAEAERVRKVSAEARRITEVWRQARPVRGQPAMAAPLELRVGR